MCRDIVTTPYKMKISLNVLNHLGLNLYSSIPAVLSEIVANSWDADATEVTLQIESDKIVICDNGIGMTREEINNQYLYVGYEKRNSKNQGFTPKGRAMMGRKGIGKLSLFSIANVISLQTLKEGETNGLILSVEKIKEHMETEQGDYQPEELPIHERIVFPHAHGTQITLTQIKKSVAPTPKALRKRVARRFSIIGEQFDFHVTINGEPVRIIDRNYFHKLQCLWHIGSKNEEYVKLCNQEVLELERELNNEIKIGETTHQVTGWVGSMKFHKDLKDDDGDDLNKITLMVNGKLAQEDLLEDISEGGVFSKYLIGEIHADFLDETKQLDIATSNRQAIKKDEERYIALVGWLKKSLNKVGTEWLNFRGTEGEKEATKIPAIKEWLEQLKSEERKKANNMFRKLNQIDFKNAEARKTMLQYSVLAFESFRYRDNLEAFDQITPENIQAVTLLFNDHDEIERTLYYQIINERLKAIHKLESLVDKNEYEKIIQGHLYEHLWLLDPTWGQVNAEGAVMEETISKAFEKINAGLSDEEKKGRVDIRYKNPLGVHVVIELKRPDRRVKQTELIDQVGKYRRALHKILKELGKNEPIQIICILGEDLAEWVDEGETDRSIRTLQAQSIQVIKYDQLLHQAKTAYNEFLNKQKVASRTSQLIEEIGKFEQFID